MIAHQVTLSVGTVNPAEKKVPVTPAITPDPWRAIIPSHSHSPKESYSTSPRSTALVAKVLSSCIAGLPKHLYDSGTRA